MVEKRFNRLELRELIENRIGTIVEPGSLEELENSLRGFDGFTSALKTGRFEQKITRRDFAKLSGSMLAILTGISANLQSCATIGLIEEGPVHYPRLPGQKIQSPEHYGLEGCMVGYFVGSSRNPAPGWAIKRKEEQTGKTPSIFIMSYYHQTHITTPLGDDVIAMMKTISEHGSIPFMTYEARYRSRAMYTKDQQKEVINEISMGKHDNAIKESARKLKKFGDQYGGFFIRTMREMNLPGSWPWAGNPKKFKKAWNHIWNIFENEGANEYATWVWNPHRYGSKESYYPGEKYVDWIGINGYDVGYITGNSVSFRETFGNSVRSLHRNHPDKPIMIAETGTYLKWGKGRWQKNAFKYVLNNKSIKSISWWSEKWNSGGTWIDTRINSDNNALKGFKEETELLQRSIWNFLRRHQTLPFKYRCLFDSGNFSIVYRSIVRGIFL